MAEAPFIASLNDSHWSIKLILTGQQCLKFGGHQPATPALKTYNCQRLLDTVSNYRVSLSCLKHTVILNGIKRAPICRRAL